MDRSPLLIALMLVAPAWHAAWAANGDGTTNPEAPYLRDRGPGIPSSMFATYVSSGQRFVYPFFEYYRDNDYEYQPSELGFTGELDFRGKYRATEFLIFLGYGVSNRLMVEFEAAVIDASLETAPDDTSDVPERIDESGLGDVEGQLRWRWNRESAERPEVFSYFEFVFPLQKDKVLIGTQDWEFKLGTGVIKGFGWGTTALRLAGEYDGEDNKAEFGEYAVEYVRRLSRTWRVYGGVEGFQDEVELITEAQLHLTPRAFLKLNNAFGLTSKATDWAPELGIMVRF